MGALRLSALTARPPPGRRLSPRPPSRAAVTAAKRARQRVEAGCAVPRLRERNVSDSAARRRVVRSVTSYKPYLGWRVTLLSCMGVGCRRDPRFLGTECTVETVFFF